MIYDALIQLCEIGDHHFTDPRPSTAGPHDDKWTPKQRVELLIYALLSRCYEYSPTEIRFLNIHLDLNVQIHSPFQAESAVLSPLLIHRVILLQCVHFSLTPLSISINGICSPSVCYHILPLRALYQQQFIQQSSQGLPLWPLTNQSLAASSPPEQRTSSTTPSATGNTKPAHSAFPRALSKRLHATILSHQPLPSTESSSSQKSNHPVNTSHASVAFPSSTTTARSSSTLLLTIPRSKESLRSFHLAALVLESIEMISTFKWCLANRRGGGDRARHRQGLRHRWPCHQK